MDTRPFAYVAFRRVFYGNVLSIVGSQMTLVAVGVQVYAITGDTADVGYTSLFALVPLVVMGLLGGALADSMDRRTLVIVSTLLTALSSVALYLQAQLELESVWLLWILVAVQSAVAALYRPARSAMIPRLIPADTVTAANTISSSTMSLGVIGGPVIAGYLIHTAGLSWTYLAEAVLLCGAVLSLLGIPPMPVGGPRTSGLFRTALRNVWEGFLFLRGQTLLLMTFVVDLIAMVFGWPLAVFPQLASQEYGTSSIGWLYAGSSIGALLAGLTSGWVSRINRQGRVIVLAIIVWGGAICLFAVTGNLPLAIFCLAVAGAADLVSASLRTSILQLVAPDEMRGRLQGVFMVVVAGGPRLGDVRLGVMASLTTPSIALLSGGVFIVVSMVVIAATVAALWRFDLRATLEAARRKPDHGVS